MSNVILVGAFGQGNPGDEALCAAFCAALGDHDVTVVSTDPDATTLQHGRPAFAPSVRAVGQAVRSADAVVVGGGTIFKQLGGSSGRRANALLVNTSALLAGARASGTSVAMIGVGAGVLRGPSARAMSRWMVPRADLVVLRDEESASVLADAGVPPPFWIGSDPAWSLFDQPDDYDRGVADQRRVTVALSHHGIGRSGIDALVAGLQPLCGERTIRLQPWQVGEHSLDLRLAEELRVRLGGGAEIIEPPIDLLHAAQIFAGDDLVIGMRFHALVAAAAAGSRFVAIAHEPKLAGLARRLRQAAVPVHASPDVMAGIIAWALAGEPSSASAVSAEIIAAKEQFQLLDLLLDGGKFERPDQLPALPLSNGRGAW
ncbi:MAG: polysaccharide pyruvyl transferase CsaB [Ilumatobacteraceae bacterium]|nr:polysaccharide pyruvyl transferase CsaB [Ilumatobacteraceae bacterium]MCU1390374.1 polysaccharide pyruvyl transferase CsaB [Ilumatobacteraceae bacterium]